VLIAVPLGASAKGLVFTLFLKFFCRAKDQMQGLVHDS
jgi:hypothetical protein